MSFEKSSTLAMLMSLSCWREMIVTLRGTSTMLSSVPNTELNGRAVGRSCFSIGTSFTWNFSIVTTSPAGARGEAVDWAWAFRASNATGRPRHAARVRGGGSLVIVP